MMLTGRNEWVAIAVLIAYIAFIPCPGFMTAFFSSSVGKIVALGVVVYVLKYVSVPVGILMFIALDRKGAIREYMEEETGMAPTPADNYKCPPEFVYDSSEKMCTKGSEKMPPECTDSSMMWDASSGKCIAKPTSAAEASTSAGPPGGTTPGAMAAANDMANTMPSGSPPIAEGFTPYSGKKEKGEFAPV